MNKRIRKKKEKLEFKKRMWMAKMIYSLLGPEIKKDILYFELEKENDTLTGRTQN